MSTIVLVGAARSGTKILRDTLASAPGVAAVPYDVNYIWRLGNEDAEHDALGLNNLAHARVQKIRKYFRGQQGAAEHLIEKTVATPLRIPFVDALLPQARYVYLVRDPVDVVESSVRQWLATPDWRYSIRKALSYPWLSAPGYAARQVAWTAKRLVGKSGAVPPWGPIYPGMVDDLASGVPIVEVCARQWEACNASAIEGFEQIGKTPVVVAYEDFARNPLGVVRSLTTQLALPPVAPASLLDVREESVGRGAARLRADERDVVRQITGATWEKCQENSVQ